MKLILSFWEIGEPISLSHPLALVLGSLYWFRCQFLRFEPEPVLNPHKLCGLAPLCFGRAPVNVTATISQSSVCVCRALCVCSFVALCPIRLLCEDDMRDFDCPLALCWPTRTNNKSRPKSFEFTFFSGTSKPVDTHSVRVQPVCGVLPALKSVCAPADQSFVTQRY